MGLFDTLAKNALGSMLGGSSRQDPAAMLSGLLSEAGGLEGLMSQFQSVGFGSQFASWVSTADNQPLSEDQMQSAIGPEALQGLASKLGMQTGTVLPLLAQFLPQVIDKLTPQGQITDNHPSSGQLQSVLTSVISSSLGGLFGGRK